ncbi:hypothetical protein CFter6_2650 [Collimonas fungivorans]|uniref:Uncharacterized protein n=1 Tax=Collimonas fungivorans TaxID=158899 RepID=A0A127PC06_9BURK|nr:hypothetical protein CFter6_2650 [Collimonas fungivorans]
MPLCFVRHAPFVSGRSQDRAVQATEQARKQYGARVPKPMFQYITSCRH